MNRMLNGCRWCSIVVVAVALWGAVGGSVQGRHVRADLVTVPVERLVTNLEALVEAKPEDAGLRYNLARLHAMAYALKAEEAEVWRDQEAQGIGRKGVMEHETGTEKETKHIQLGRGRRHGDG